MEDWKEPKLQKILNKLDFLFLWVKIFYPHFKGLKNYYLLFFFFPQKILRINGSCKWPVHFTSRVLFSKKIKTGYNSAPGLSNGCYIQGKNGIIIGNNVRMGPGVGLISANHNPDDFDKWIKTDPIEIGDNVWLGMNVVVLPGIKIGDNVIIASNSVVTKDVPSNSIAAGAPCKVIKEKEAYKGFDYSKL
jgi:acetyltransferase-like isoleucine patch superfamily enzyme